VSTRRVRLVRTGITVGAVVLAVFCAGVGPYAGTALVVSAPLSSPDAIVSLASHEWERLPAAAELARRYPRAVVVLTLPQPVNEFNCHDCFHRTERLMKAGVEMERIQIVPLTERGTFGEAVATRAFVSKHNLKSVLVVTSPYHTRRSLATFRQVLEGAAVSVGVVPASATSPARPPRWWATPYDRAYVRYEWAAVFYYWFRYGVPPADER
jgi:uncharacterized SAM-binding protein YcdF (DUF218 family)